MKLPKTYFSNLTASKYKEYLKLLPDIQKENTRAVVTLIFTFFAMSFFGIFAINPTLSTIVTLKKQLSDSELVHNNLKTKISNLSSLQQQYTQLNSDLPLVFEAVPKNAQATILLGQIMGLAKEKRVDITSLEAANIELLEAAQLPTSPEASSVVPGVAVDIPGGPAPLGESMTIGTDAKSSFNFSIKAQGTYGDLMSYAKSLTQLSRIISVESISINKDAKENTLVLDLDGRAYYQK